MRANLRLVHAIAECNDCDWTEGYYIDAMKKGRSHAIKHKHRVTIETGYAGEYNGKE